MLFTVTGAGDHASVVGLRSGDRQGLLQLAAGAEPIVALTPRHHLADTRRQAHVLLAGAPLARVCVLPLDHHPLTLVLIAEALQRSSQARAGWPDPSAAVQLAQRYAARSHSLVWYRTLWGLSEPTPTAGQLAAGTFRRAGHIRELAAAPALVPARPGSPVALGAAVHHVQGVPALLAQQLGEVTLLPVELTTEPGPYSTRTSVELTLLATADLHTGNEGRCGSCDAGLVAGQCPFCGHGPWTAAQPVTGADQWRSRTAATAPPATHTGPLPPAAPPVSTPSGSPVPVGAGGPNHEGGPA